MTCALEPSLQVVSFASDTNSPLTNMHANMHTVLPVDEDTHHAN